MADVSLLFNVLARDNTGAALNSAAGGFQRTFDKVSKIVAVGMGAAAVALVGFAKDAEESARVGRMTEAVVTSTGHAAGLTADQVGDLATAISNKTGADDEAIQSGENMLLTFTNIHDEVGKGNDIFTQATSTAVDLAAAMNGGQVSADGLKTANIQLGKALNDPIKGVGALSKVGVSFTAQQKDQIATMVKAGDTMGAQKVILGELNKEFGGAAVAASDPMMRLTTVLGNLGEQIGGIVLPYVEDFSTAMATAAGWLSRHESTAKTLGITLGILGTAILVVRTGMMAMAAWTALTTGAWTALATVMWANPVFIIAGIILGIGAALVFAWKKSETFRDIVTGAFNALVGVIAGVVKIWANLILGFWGGVLDAIAAIPFAEKVIPGLKTAKDAVHGFRDDVNAEIDSIQKRVQIDVVINTVHTTNEPLSAQLAGVQDEKNAAAAYHRAHGAFNTESYTTQSTSTTGPVPTVHGGSTGGGGGGGGGSSAAADAAKRSAEEVRKALVAAAKQVRSSAFLAAIVGTPDKIKAEFDTLETSLKAAHKSALLHVTNAIESTMVALAKRRDALEEKIKNSRLVQIHKNASDYAKAFRDSADITRMSEGGTLTSLLDQLTRQRDKAQAFTREMRQLRALNLNAASLAQLAAAGPEQGLAAVQQILSGGQGAVDQVNRLMTQISAAGGSFGTSDAERRLGIGSAGAAAEEAAMRRQQAQLVSSLNKLANQTVRLELNVTGADKEMKALIRKIVRETGQGGSVQAALGKA